MYDDLLSTANTLYLTLEDKKQYDALVSFITEVTYTRVKDNERFLPARFKDLLIFYRTHSPDLKIVANQALKDMGDFLMRVDAVEDDAYYVKLILAISILEKSLYSVPNYIRDVKKLTSSQFLGLNISFSKRVLGTTTAYTIDQTTAVLISDKDNQVKSLAVSLDDEQYNTLSKAFLSESKQGKMLSLSIEQRKEQN